MTPTCQNHKKDVAGITDMKELAKMITDLHYESLAELFAHLFIKFGEDGKKDIKAGKMHLGLKLLTIETKVFSAYLEIKDAWEISKPFMEAKSK